MSIVRLRIAIQVDNAQAQLQQLTLGNATATAFAAGQPPSAAINGVVGEGEGAGSSNWFAANVPTVLTISLGGAQRVDEVRVYWLGADTSRTERKIELLNAEQNVVHTVADRSLTAIATAGSPETLPVPGIEANFVRISGYGRVIETDQSTEPWTILMELECWGEQLNGPVFTTQPTEHQFVFQPLAGTAQQMWGGHQDQRILPTAVGQSVTFDHPDGLPQQVKVTKLADPDSLEAANGATYDPNGTMTTYVTISPFSMTGAYVITNGVQHRELFEARGSYQHIRRVTAPNSGKLSEWLWSEDDESLAYYLDDVNNLLMRYDVTADTHTIVRDFDGYSVALTQGGQFSGQLGASDGGLPCGGAGTAYHQGRIAFKMQDGTDSCMVVFNVLTNAVEFAALIPGLIASVQNSGSGVDEVRLVDGGQYVWAQFSGDAIYGTSLGTVQTRIFPLDSNFAANNGQLVSLGGPHQDVTVLDNGAPVLVQSDHTIVQGSHSQGINNRDITRARYDRTIMGGTLATHTCVVGNLAMMSPYRGGGSEGYMPFVVEDISNPGDIAWFGWPNVTDVQNAFNYYVVQQKGVMDRVLNDAGESTYKMAFVSDNQAHNLQINGVPQAAAGGWTQARTWRTANLYIAELIDTRV